MKIEKANFMVNAKWANLNKNNTIGEYFYEVFMKADYTVTKMKVLEVVTLNYEEWYDFKNGLLDDRDWLKGKGGTDSDFELSPEREKEVKRFYDLTPEERNAWIEQSYSIGLIVQLEDSYERVAVNPEGYDYARYVGVEVTEI